MGLLFAHNTICSSKTITVHWGNSPPIRAYMTKDIKSCPLCKKEFGIFRFRYECASCHGTFCDDCTPNKYVVPPSSSAEKVCMTCEPRLGSSVRNAEGGRRLGTSNDKPNDSVEDDRERRAKIAEERSQAARIAGPPKQRAHPHLSSSKHVAETAAVATTSSPAVGRTLGGTTETKDEANPVLAAALRRQQQHPSSQRAPVDPERAQLFGDITALLRARNEEEPFGLRAMDATKLRLYLRHLRGDK